MYPQCPLPGHITALYLVAVASCLALFGRGLVSADILVYSKDDHLEPEIEFRDMPAKFGDSLPLGGLQGVMRVADPPTACSEISPPPYPPPEPYKWVVLIQRYGCNFEDKVRWAQKASYSAAIVYNVNSSELEPMSAKNAADIVIPSVFVSNETGAMLRDVFVYNESNEYFVVVNDYLPFNINTHLLLPFAIVVGICFVVMLVFMVVKCVKDRRRQRRHRLPSSSLRKIPTAKFSKGDPYETCAICLEDYQEGEKLRILPCSHAYHTKCIDPWLTRNRRVCPVCKRKVFAHDEHVSDSDSDSDSDDTAPLVRSGHSSTQGGTFSTQVENPFVVASRAAHGGSLSSLSSASSGVSGGRQAPSSSGGGRGFPQAPQLPEEADVEVAVCHSINSPPDLPTSEDTTEVAVEVNPAVGGRGQDRVV